MRVQPRNFWVVQHKISLSLMMESFAYFLFSVKLSLQHLLVSINSLETLRAVSVDWAARVVCAFVTCSALFHLLVTSGKGK